MNRGLQILLLILLFIAYSCKCPTEIDTTRVIEPNNSSEAIFYNISNIQNVDFYSNEVPVAEQIVQNSNTDYKKVYTGMSLINIYENGKKDLLAGVPYEFEKNNQYSIFFYNYKDFYNCLIDDDISSQKNSTLIRFYNFNDSHRYVIFEIIQNNSNYLSSQIKFANETEYISIESSFLKIKVIDLEKQNLLDELEYKFLQGKIYTVLYSKQGIEIFQ